MAEEGLVSMLSVATEEVAEAMARTKAMMGSSAVDLASTGGSIGFVLRFDV